MASLVSFRRRGWICVALIGLLVPGPFWPALSNGSEFVFDDIPAILKNSDVTSQSVNLSRIFHNDFWGDPLKSARSHKSYRPLTVLLFRLIVHLFGFNVKVFRSINLLLHTLNSVLVFMIARRWLFHLKAALFAALLFAWHPVHVESIMAGVGLADVTYSGLCLWAIFLCQNQGPICSMVEISGLSILTLGAMFFKEPGIMLPSLVLINGFCLDPRRRPIVYQVRVWLWKAIAFLIITLMCLAMRLKIMNFKQPSFKLEDNPAIFMNSFQARALNHAYHHALNAWLLLCPDWLCFDWSMGCLTPIFSCLDIRCLFISLFWVYLANILVMIWISNHRNSKCIISATGLSIASFLPASNVFFNVGFVIAERNLYLPSVGSCLIVALATQNIPIKRLAPYFQIIQLFMLVIFGLRCSQRSLDWKSELGLFQSGLRVCPNNAKVHYNIAKRLADQDKDHMSLLQYERALQLHPKYEHALNNLGNLYRKMKKPAKALEFLERAVAINPEFSTAWMNLGVTQAQIGALLEAERSYHQALEYRSDYPDCHFNLGNLYLKMKNLDRASKCFERAIFLNPEHKSAWANLILLKDEQKLWDDAEHLAKSATARFPEESDFPFHLANLYGKIDRFEKAEQLFLSALTLAENPNTSNGRNRGLYHNNLGVLYHRWKKYRLAAQHYEMALVLDANNFNTKQNLESIQKFL
ncbi:protein O-mannosyl-transferase TMTC4-like [Tigriopus californicus]|uniref:protein O-mannosyl-transferase TMTC4-like n=1 Tax=Tigriopus californicus TaxID=6832 RepID=UPI0027DA1307|nr:protein O-mannosyl-transferase TMTC4-like [Tigriopus californicus]